MSLGGRYCPAPYRTLTRAGVSSEPARAARAARIAADQPAGAASTRLVQVIEEKIDSSNGVAAEYTLYQVRPGTPFSPDQIAEKYWSVVQSEGTWQSEFRFDGT
jgi:hypothetical protein